MTLRSLAFRRLHRLPLSMQPRVTCTFFTTRMPCGAAMRFGDHPTSGERMRLSAAPAFQGRMLYGGAMHSGEAMPCGVAPHSTDSTPCGAAMHSGDHPAAPKLNLYPLISMERISREQREAC